jgi:hypothetical protein
MRHMPFKRVIKKHEVLTRQSKALGARERGEKAENACERRRMRIMREQGTWRARARILLRSASSHVSPALLQSISNTCSELFARRELALTSLYIDTERETVACKTLVSVTRSPAALSKYKALCNSSLTPHSLKA